MSSAGQIVGGLVGGAIGSAFGSTFLGAQLGMMLGGAIDPPPGPVEEGPRLSDLTVQTSTYGAMIPDVFGTDAISGNVFWLENNKIKETPVKKKTGGKGGQKKTTVTWVNTATFAVGLCRGPIVGVRRIWLKGELFYDAGATDYNTIVASTAAAAGFHVYTGTDTQQPDPRIQADLGVNSASAWRGMAYIVFYDLDLAKYGGSLVGVQVKVEVMQTGTTSTYPYTALTQPNQNWRRPAWDGTVYCSVAYFAHFVTTSPDGLDWTTYSIPNGNSAAYQGCASDGAGVLLAYGTGTLTNMWMSTNHGVSWAESPLPGFNGYVTQVEWNGSYFLAITDTGPFFTSSNGSTWIAETAPASGTFARSLCWHQGSSKWYVCTQFGGHPIIYASATGTAGTWSIVYTMPGDLNNFDQCCIHNGRILYIGLGTVGSYGPCMVYSDDGSTWNYAAVPMRQYYILSDGQNCWVGDSNGAMAYSPDGVTNWTNWTGPFQGIDHEGIYANGFIVCLGSGGTAGYRISKSSVSISPTTLSAIVSAKCLHSNLLSNGDIDVTQLTDAVRGYVDSSIGSIRGTLEPLQLAWPFDVRQHGYKLQFVRRGGSYGTVIEAGDLDARGSAESPGVEVTVSREMNQQLPRRITVRHTDIDNEYGVGEQYAERLNTDSVNENTHDLAIVMTSGECAAVADILLYMNWMERSDISFSLPATYSQIEPADVVLLPIAGSWASVRVVSCNYTTDERIEIAGKYANPAAYVSTVVGSAPVVTGQTTINLAGRSSYVLLDVPMMHTTQADPSFLASMYGNDTWEGGVLLRSDDSGTTWFDLQAFGQPGGTVATASTAIGVVDSRTWDAASVLSVTTLHGDLYSATAEAVLNGANHFAYGADGRWEIVGVQNCVLVSANTYTLTNMLRGRYGTEWAMSTHQVGDKLVLLGAEDVTAIGMSAATIGASRIYRGVTLDQDISTDVDFPFTYQGVNLKPLSPVHLTGARAVGSYDWVFTWVRRSRTDPEWRDNVDVSLGETSEAYELVVYSDSSFTVVKRTITAATATATYSEVSQIADFGIAQTNTYVRLYQMSSVVGRGYPNTMSLVAQGGFPYWSSVGLQLPMTGVNGSTVFTVSKGVAPTVFGDAKISTTRSPFVSSALFDRVNDYIAMPTSSDWAFGTGDFTVEAWVFVTSLPGGGVTNDMTVFGRLTTPPFIYCYIDNTTGIPVMWNNSVGVSHVTAVTLNAWNHVAWTRASGTARVFLNGVLGNTVGSYSTDLTSTTEYNIGGTVAASRFFGGNMGPVRVTKGVARYTTTFAAPTGPFEENAADPYWSNTVLLMPMTSVSGFSDKKGKVVTVNGGMGIVAGAGPFGSSCYFDGSGDYLTEPTTPNLEVAAGDFTIECWIYRTIDMGSGTFRLVNEWNGTTGYKFSVVNNNITFSCNNGTSYSVTGGATTINTWHYVTAKRVAGVISVSIGTSATSSSVSGSIPTPVGTTYIGRASEGATEHWTGYIGPVRFTVGVGLNVTIVPTGPFPTY